MKKSILEAEIKQEHTKLEKATTEEKTAQAKLDKTMEESQKVTSALTHELKQLALYRVAKASKLNQDF